MAQNRIPVSALSLRGFKWTVELANIFLMHILLCPYLKIFLFYEKPMIKRSI